MPQTLLFEPTKIEPEIKSPITLEIKGVVPSFKTQKTAYGWRDKATGKIFARPATLPEHKKWMSRCAQNFASALRSVFQITEFTIPTGATLQSLIASLPQDDCWSAIPETELKSELCEPGKEGATIVIERL